MLERLAKKKRHHVGAKAYKRISVTCINNEERVT